jgi:Iap family predicted aminopeptidase
LRTALTADGVTISGLQLARVVCSGDYASAVISAPGVQPAFVVFEASARTWKVVNTGTSFVCQPLGIAEPDYSAIGCPSWDR